MADEFKVPKENVISAFNTYIDQFDEIVVVGKFKKEFRKAEDGTYYLASSCSAEKTDNVLNGAMDEWL